MSAIKNIIKSLILYVTNIPHIFSFLLFKLKYKDCRSRLDSCGNYFINTNDFRHDLPVYSCGVGGNIEFDIEINNKTNAKVYLFDFTPGVPEYIEECNLSDDFHFEEVGIWNQDTEIEIPYILSKFGNVKTMSITNIHDFNLTMKRPVKRIPTLMKQFGHKEIGVLKLDIEGAALSVLEDCQNEKIFPNIILGEIERDPKDPKQFTKQFNALIANLKGIGYEVYIDTSDIRRFFSSIEIYCVKK
jgi:FkbM family methyltransferase